MGIFFLAAVWVWATVGLLYGLLSYIRKKDFRKEIEREPLRYLIVLLLFGFPIAMKNVVIPIIINTIGFLLGWERKNNPNEE